MTDAIENCIRVACQIFTLAALLLFVICGQVLVAYHQSITKQLEDYQHIHHPRTMEHLWFILSQFRPLIEIRRRLYRDFRYILLANVCLSLVTILAAAYFVLHYMTSSQESRISRFLIIFWDGADVLESFTRLWLVCHINDKIHSSVRHFILEFYNIFIISLSDLFIVRQLVVSLFYVKYEIGLDQQENDIRYTVQYLINHCNRVSLIPSYCRLLCFS